MADFFSEYFINPIFDRTGYNLTNTLVYAGIALAAVYVIWRLMKARHVEFASKEFLAGVAAFVIFGAGCRTVTDLTDSGLLSAMAAQGGAIGGVYGAVDATGIFHYSLLTVTPGIYILTAIFFLLSFATGRALGMRWFVAIAGFSLALPCLLLLLPFVAHPYYAALALAITAAGSLAVYFILSRAGLKLGMHEKLAIAGQALDGAATFVVIDIFSLESGKGYFEQHVLSAGIGEATPLGFFLFFLLKAALAGAIVYLLSKEDVPHKDKAFVLILVAVMGFGPGLRNLLRMACGT